MRSAAIVEVDRLLKELEQNLESAKLSLKQQEDTLGEVKVYGRRVDTAAPIFTKRGISILSQYGLDREPSNASREALRCLANALLLNEASRQVFVDLGYPPKAADRLRVNDPDEEFLASRILFLLTYNKTLDFPWLVDQQQLAESINRCISQHAKNILKTSLSTSTMQSMAMVETLKLLFNITYYYPALIPKFSPSMEPLLDIILQHPLPDPPLQPPITYVLNALLNLDFEESERTNSPSTGNSISSGVVADRLVDIFDKAIKKQPEKDLDQAAAPLCTLLRRAFQLATSQVKSQMRSLLLPTPKDRDKPLGRGDTLSARLLRLSCSPNLPTLRENISGLLFELSDKDAKKLIQNIGYGFASGFLMSHNIQIPADAVETDHSGNGRGVDVNPITGQRWEAEDRDRPDVSEMTEEEKEREAERLFVLFERLKATGVVDVQNPVQQAIDEGRFEELD